MFDVFLSFTPIVTKNKYLYYPVFGLITKHVDVLVTSHLTLELMTIV
jgi:hypothetical protein